MPSGIYTRTEKHREAISAGSRKFWRRYTRKDDMATATGEEHGDFEKIGRVVRKCYGTETLDERGKNEGEFAVIVSVISQPVFILEDQEGVRFTWIQSITRPATDSESLDYWKRRAKAAEDKLSGIGAA